MELFKQLSWDTDFFGFSVVKIVTELHSITDYSNCLEELAQHKITLAYYSTNSKITWLPIDNHIHFVDNPCIYEMNLADYSKEMPQDIEIYNSSLCTQELYAIGIQCGVYSRFKIDTKIPIERFNQLYRLWIENSVNKSFADDVLVAYKNGVVVGLVTIAIAKETAKIGLLGVDTNSRGQGIASKLLQAACAYAKNNSCSSIEVSTQVQNIPACKSYEKAGFIVKEASYTYHIWL